MFVGFTFVLFISKLIHWLHMTFLNSSSIITRKLDLYVAGEGERDK